MPAHDHQLGCLGPPGPDSGWWLAKPQPAAGSRKSGAGVTVLLIVATYRHSLSLKPVQLP
jgi:hypothetical protein